MDDFDSEFVENIKPRLHVPSPTVDFDVASWRPAEIADITNDYTYSLDMQSAGDARLGQLMLKPLLWDLPPDRKSFGKSISREEFRRCAEGDGLFYLEDLLPEGNGHVIAGFGREALANSMPEVLLARRDSNGRFSFRPPVEKGGCRGSGLPRQVDYSGEPIENVRAANFGPFKRFLGYLSIPYAGINFYPRT